MIAEYAYDSRRSPPAPVMPLAAMPPVGGDAVALRVLIDSGADLTVLPAGTAACVRLPRIGAMRVRAAGGAVSRVPLYAARLRIGDTEVVAEVAELGSDALLGRDVLNAWIVTLDGPAGVTRIQAPDRSRRTPH